MYDPVGARFIGVLGSMPIRKDAQFGRLYDGHRSYIMCIIDRPHLREKETNGQTKIS